MAWTPHKEGDAISLAAVNSNIDALEEQANAVSAGAIMPKSLHAEHLPSVIERRASKTMAGSVQSYTNRYPGWGVDTSFSPLEQWLPISSVGGDLEVEFSMGIDLTKHKLLVMANIGVKNINHNPDGNAGVTKGRAAVKIQVQVGGVWQGINKTERYLSSRQKTFGDTITLTRHGDIPIRTLIDSTDLSAPTTGTITGVRVVISVLYGVLSTDYDAVVKVLNCNLSAVAIRQALD